LFMFKVSVNDQYKNQNILNIHLVHKTHVLIECPCGLVTRTYLHVDFMAATVAMLAEFKFYVGFS
jgi:hypothetical protein